MRSDIRKKKGVDFNMMEEPIVVIGSLAFIVIILGLTGLLIIAERRKKKSK